MKKIAAINDLSSFGRCSLTAALPVISALGVQCCPLVTGIYSNQTEYESYYMLDFTEHMKPCLEQWKKLGVRFDAILSGYISCAKQAEVICEMIDDFRTDKTIVVVDPVMGDSGQLYPGYGKDRMNAVKNLAEKADIITPNLTELCTLCETDYYALVSLGEDKLLDRVKKLSESLCSKNEKAVITTGIQLKDGKIANAIYQNGTFGIVTADKFGESFSGTGDIFASFITAQAVKGVQLKTAVRQASDFIGKAAKATGGDYDRNDGINFEKYLCELGRDDL